MKNNFYKVFSILLCIATLFMGVGYASINSISLNISGEMITQAQNGIFITAVNYNEELSNNVLVTDSRINSSHQTNLDSSIVLTNSADSQITYNITIHNSNNLAYVFDGVEHTIGENTYSNENITYKLTNLVEGDIVNSNDDISFSITFYFKDSGNISDVKLKSLLNFKFSIVSYVVDTFEYTGNYETFTVPHDGIYKIELWGASGGFYSDYEFGKGAYTSGNIFLENNEEIFIYVGGQGNVSTGDGIEMIGGYNGGGYASYFGSTGGGATDVRIDTKLNSRIIVAGGGGGTGMYKSVETGGNAGGLKGYTGGSYSDPSIVYAGTGGTQTSGGIYGEAYLGSATGDRHLGTNGIFGIGGNGGFEVNYMMGSGAGGGGYYGGGGGSERNGGGGGGSSFISGHNGCDAITEYSTEDNIIHTGQSIHYSGYQFTDTVMIDGEGYNWTTERGSLIGMPTYDGTATMTGNTGNGYAKITFISEN